MSIPIAAYPTDRDPLITTETDKNKYTKKLLTAPSKIPCRFCTVRRLYPLAKSRFQKTQNLLSSVHIGCPVIIHAITSPATLWHPEPSTCASGDHRSFAYPMRLARIAQFRRDLFPTWVVECCPSECCMSDTSCTPTRTHKMLAPSRLGKGFSLPFISQLYSLPSRSDTAVAK